MKGEVDSSILSGSTISPVYGMRRILSGAIVLAIDHMERNVPTLVDAAALESFVRDIFTAAGCDADEAGRIAEHLVRADLTGHDSHGVVRVPRYV